MEATSSTSTASAPARKSYRRAREGEEGETEREMQDMWNERPWWTDGLMFAIVALIAVIALIVASVAAAGVPNTGSTLRVTDVNASNAVTANDLSTLHIVSGDSHTSDLFIDAPTPDGASWQYTVNAATGNLELSYDNGVNGPVLVQSWAPVTAAAPAVPATQTTTTTTTTTA